MGIFSSIKKNLNHGGIKIKLDAPTSIHWDDKNYVANVTVSASEPQTIKSVRLELINQITGASDNNQNPGANMGQQEIMFSVTDDNSFKLQGGDSKVIEIPFGISALKTGNKTVDSIANIMGKIGEAANALDTNEREYNLIVYVDVDGIKFDPSRSLRINVLKPNEAGGSAGVNF